MRVSARASARISSHNGLVSMFHPLKPACHAGLRRASAANVNAIVPRSARSARSARRRSASARHRAIIPLRPRLASTEPSQNPRRNFARRRAGDHHRGVLVRQRGRRTVSSRPQSGTMADRSVNCREDVRPVRSRMTPPTQETARLPPPPGSSTAGPGSGADAAARRAGLPPPAPGKSLPASRRCGGSRQIVGQIMLVRQDHPPGVDPGVEGQTRVGEQPPEESVRLPLDEVRPALSLSFTSRSLAGHGGTWE